MKISQQFLDSVPRTAAVRKRGLSGFADVFFLQGEGWHWIRILPQESPELHTLLCLLAPPLHSSGQTIDRSNVHQMAACHIENQSLKSIFSLFFFFSFQDAPINLIKCHDLRNLGDALQVLPPLPVLRGASAWEDGILMGCPHFPAHFWLGRENEIHNGATVFPEGLQGMSLLSRVIAWHMLGHHRCEDCTSICGA